LAFVVAAAVTAYRWSLRSRLDQIKLTPPAHRVEVINNELNAFGIDAARLTREQQYQLALRELSLRALKFRTVSLIMTFCVAVFGGAAVYALYRAPDSTAIGQQAHDEPLTGQALNPIALSRFSSALKEARNHYDLGLHDASSLDLFEDAIKLLPSSYADQLNHEEVEKARRARNALHFSEAAAYYMQALDAIDRSTGEPLPASQVEQPQ
jgi:hypothetical protein